MQLEVLCVKENDDGSAEIELSLDDEYKNKIKKILGLKRWSKKKFETFVINTLKDQLKNNI